MTFAATSHAWWRVDVSNILVTWLTLVPCTSSYVTNNFAQIKHPLADATMSGLSLAY